MVAFLLRVSAKISLNRVDLNRIIRPFKTIIFENRIELIFLYNRSILDLIIKKKVTKMLIFIYYQSLLSLQDFSIRFKIEESFINNHT